MTVIVGRNIHTEQTFYLLTKSLIYVGTALGTRSDRAQQIVREPAVGLIMWLRPEGLKVYSYVEKYAEFKNQSLKKSAGT